MSSKPACIAGHSTLANRLVPVRRRTPIGRVRRLRCASASIAASLAAICAVSAHPAATPDDPTPLERTERTDHLRRALVTRLDALRDELQLPGLSIAVVADGEPLLVAGFGVADIDSGHALDETTAMRIGPLAETMVALLAAIVVDAGEASWETTLIDGVPAVRLRTAELSRGATLAALLGHRAGILLDDRLWSSAPSRDEVRAALAEAEMGPSGRVHESAAGAFAALALLGERSRSDGPTALRTRLLEPLGMELAQSDAPPTKRAVDHRRADLGRPVAVPEGVGGNALWPVRGQWSSASAIVPYLALLADMGRMGDRRLVSRERMSRLLSMHESASTSDLTDRRMGLSWEVERWRGRLRAGRSGTDGDHAAAIAVLPQDRIALAVFAPVGDADALDALVESTLETLVGAKTAAKDDDALERLGDDAPLGRFGVGPGAAIATVTRAGGRHVLHLQGQPPIYLLEPDASGRLAGVAGDMVMLDRAAGAEHGVLIDDDGPFLLLRRHGLPTVLAAASVDHRLLSEAAVKHGVGALIGSYRAADGEVGASIGLGAGGAPTLVLSGQLPLAMAPSGAPDAHGFATRWRVIAMADAGFDVERGVDGAPRRFTLVSPRTSMALDPVVVSPDPDPIRAAKALLSLAPPPASMSAAIRLAGTLRMPSQAVRATVELVHLPDRTDAVLSSPLLGTTIIQATIAPGARPRDVGGMTVDRGVGPIERPLDRHLRRALVDLVLALRAPEVIGRGDGAILIGASEIVEGAMCVATALVGHDGADDLRIVLHIEPTSGTIAVVELPDAGPLLVRPTRQELINGVATVIEATFDHPSLGVATLTLSGW